MTKLIDKTPRNLRGYYKRLNQPLYLSEEGYNVLGVEHQGDYPALDNLDSRSFFPEAIIINHKRRFYIGDISSNFSHTSLASGRFSRERPLLTILYVPYFEDSFRKTYGSLDIEKELYAPELRLWTPKGEINVGFNENKLKMNYLFNHFLREKSSIEALIGHSLVIPLHNGNYITIHPGYRLKFKQSLLERLK